MPHREPEEAKTDPRGPLYIGFWKRSIPTNFKKFLDQSKSVRDAAVQNEVRRAFPFGMTGKADMKTAQLKKSHFDAAEPFNFSDEPAVDEYDEPHFKRRLAILQKYPSMMKLCGIEKSSRYIFLGCLLVQFLMLYSFSPLGFLYEAPIWLMVVLSYAVGASCTQIAGILMHEATHNLVFDGGNNPNIIFGLVLNTLIVAPVGYAFRRYHLLHHQYQGVVGMDPDLPFTMEYSLIKGNILMKTLWIMMYPLMYLVRSFALKMLPTKLEIMNWFQCFAWDYGIYKTFGSYSFGYFLLSTYFGFSFHVAAAHFIQEHYTWVSGQETYSYYGPLNKLFLNIGYHNEHHDFTKVNQDVLYFIYLIFCLGPLVATSCSLREGP